MTHAEKIADWAKNATLEQLKKRLEKEHEISKVFKAFDERHHKNDTTEHEQTIAILEEELRTRQS